MIQILFDLITHELGIPVQVFYGGLVSKFRRATKRSTLFDQMKTLSEILKSINPIAVIVMVPSCIAC